MNDDLISRLAAIDVAMNDNLIVNAMDSVKDGDIHRTKRAIVRLLASLPSAQPEQKTGKWIVDEDGNIECSICGHHGVGDLYCERCGAKMDEGGERREDASNGTD